MKKALLILLGIFLPLTICTITAQQVGIKSNALYWATSTPNLGVEIATGLKTTINISGAYNPWTFGSAEDNKKIRHWAVTGQLRFWPYERWDGHFLGVHALFASYNAGGVDIPLVGLSKLKDSRYEGYATGVGFSYGYQWYLSPHWNLELTAGLGYVYYNYERYECRKCGAFIERAHKHWLGPTNLGLSLIYLIKSK
ncbi:MAG: DUF3575 domain-containing protein [Alistipes sp.]|nr:DUF3575 domain-containing protein [Alistipes sp.]